MRDVAALSRVSLATVLHYFGSKGGLYAACVRAMDDELATLRAELLAVAKPGVTRGELVAAMVRKSWTFACVHRVAHRIILRTALDEGGLPTDRLLHLLRPSLDDAELFLAPLLGVAPSRTRLAMQTLIHLVARYAISSHDELKAVTGVSVIHDAERVIGEHLVEVALGLLVEPAARSLPCIPATSQGHP